MKVIKDHQYEPMQPNDDVTSHEGWVHNQNRDKETFRLNNDSYC